MTRGVGSIYGAALVVALVAVLALLAVGCNSESPSPTPGPSPVSSVPTRSTSAILRLPDIAGVVQEARPAVVSVLVEVLVRDIFGTLRVFEDSSGVIFDPEGYILTNNHVITGAQKITVTLDDGRQFEAEVVGGDRFTDLAVLKIENGEQFPSVPLGSPNNVRVGDWVIAIGNALALPGGPTVTLGIISALDRTYRVGSGVDLYGLIQTDASINPGNSGGPLINLRGEVVGISTAVARDDRTGSDVEGIGFAVGMDTAIPITGQLMEKGQVSWPYLGVELDNLDPQMAAHLNVPVWEGAVITNAVEGSPAWNAGIRQGDVVVSFGGERVPDVRELLRLLRHEHWVEDEVEIRAYRGDEEMDFRVVLESRPGG